MANCSTMTPGDLFVCNNCGLELRVAKRCNCSIGSGASCEVPLKCCGQDMTKGAL